MRKAREIECWLTDMDGVLVHEEQALPGAAELIQRWVDTSKRFLVLTNNSLFTPRDLAARLKRSGLRIPQDNIWTSAMATGAFLKSQAGDKTAYVIGEAGPHHRPARCRVRNDREQTPTSWCSARPATSRSRRSPRRSG